MADSAVAANIAVVGLALFSAGFSGVGACVQLGIPMIVLLIIFSQAGCILNSLHLMRHTTQELHL